jgi:hypothetical protein
MLRYLVCANLLANHSVSGLHLVRNRYQVSVRSCSPPPVFRNLQPEAAAHRMAR